jgi:uncharacterized membrane protein YkoI
MAGDCPIGPDRPLLIYVSNLSGRLRQDAGVKRKPNLIRRAAGTAGLAIAVALAALPTTAARADGHEQDELHQAVKRGEIRSLADILAAIRDQLPGEVAGVEVERKNGHWIYEFRVVDGRGHLFEVRVDARSAAIERVKEK